MYIFRSGSFISELWVINLLVLIHSGNMKRSGFQSKAIPKVSVIFYYIIMLHVVSRQQIKIAGQVNKERKRHARKPPYIHTNTKGFINNYLERIY